MAGGSVLAEPAADVHRLPGDGFGIRHGEETDQPRDLVRPHVPTEREPLVLPLQHVFGGYPPGLGVPRPGPGGQLGVDEAGADRVDGDAVRREFDGQRLGQADHTVLARGVGHGQLHALLSTGGGDVDDPPPAAFTRTRALQPAAGHPEHAVEIDVDEPFPRLVRQLVGGSAAPHTGVVDQDVDAAELADGAVEQRVDARLVPHVDDVSAGAGQPGVLERPHAGVDTLRRRTGDEYGCAELAELRGARLPDAAGSSGYQGDRAGEWSLHQPKLSGAATVDNGRLNKVDAVELVRGTTSEPTSVAGVECGLEPGLRP